MGQPVNPGALAGATGATNPSVLYKDCHETVSGHGSDIQRSARRIENRRSLAQSRSIATYAIGLPDGGKKKIKLQKRNRQVLETLMQHPIYCGSIVRISESVRVLRHEYEIDIETLEFPDHAYGETVIYGIYVLRQPIELLTPELPLEHAGCAR